MGSKHQYDKVTKIWRRRVVGAIVRCALICPVIEMVYFFFKVSINSLQSMKHACKNFRKYKIILHCTEIYCAKVQKEARKFMCYVQKVGSEMVEEDK